MIESRCSWEGRAARRGREGVGDWIRQNFTLRDLTGAGFTFGCVFEFGGQSLGGWGLTFYGRGHGVRLNLYEVGFGRTV